MRATILTAWIMLTALDGRPVWVDTNHLFIIRPSLSQCNVGNGAAIRVGGGTGLCVKETPEQILEKMRNGR